MSYTLRGVTFTGQAVTSAADGTVQSAMLRDGRLSGIGISYAGNTLTITQGYMLSGGRITLLSGVSSWILNQATSGYARLILQLDMSKTATASAWEQGTILTEYAATLDALRALATEPINGTGSVYEMEICVVSLASTGISEIVRQLPDAVPRFATVKIGNADFDGTSNVTLAAMGAAALVDGKVDPAQAASDIVWIDASTTLTANHLGKFLVMGSSSATTITLPNSSDIPVGTEIEIYHHGAGAVYVQSESGCYISFDGKSTASRKLTIPRFGAVGMKKVTSATWKVSGEAKG